MFNPYIITSCTGLYLTDRRISIIRIKYNCHKKKKKSILFFTIPLGVVKMNLFINSTITSLMCQVFDALLSLLLKLAFEY